MSWLIVFVLPEIINRFQNFDYDGGFLPLHITFRVAEPAGLAHRLRPSANGVTGQGLGEVTNEVRNVAGNAVLGEGGVQTG